MKASSLTVSLVAALTLFSLAGCQTSPSASQQNVSTSTVPVTNNVDTPVKNQPMPLNTASDADRVAYYGALELKDATYCDKITDTELKNTCNTDIKNDATLQKAVKELNGSFCSQLSTQDKQKACTIRVEIAVQKSETLKKEKADVTKSEEVLMSGDIARCSKDLSNADMIAYCEYNIAVNKAVEAKDSGLCKEIHDGKHQKLCEDTYKIAVAE